MMPVTVSSTNTQTVASRICSNQLIFSFGRCLPYAGQECLVVTEPSVSLIRVHLTDVMHPAAMCRVAAEALIFVEAIALRCSI